MALFQFDGDLSLSPLGNSFERAAIIEPDFHEVFAFVAIYFWPELIIVASDSLKWPSKSGNNNNNNNNSGSNK